MVWRGSGGIWLVEVEGTFGEVWLGSGGIWLVEVEGRSRKVWLVKGGSGGIWLMEAEERSGEVWLVERGSGGIWLVASFETWPTVCEKRNATFRRKYVMEGVESRAWKALPTAASGRSCFRAVLRNTAYVRKRHRFSSAFLQPPVRTYVCTYVCLSNNHASYSVKALLKGGCILGDVLGSAQRHWLSCICCSGRSLSSRPNFVLHTAFYTHRLLRLELCYTIHHTYITCTGVVYQFLSHYSRKWWWE